MKRTRVAVVGTGFIGMAHLEALRRIPQVEIVAICGLEADRVRAQAQAWDVPQWYDSCEAMLQNAKVDAIHNCTPNGAHDAVNRMAIAAGVHVYAEKPLSDTAAEAHATWQRAERAGVVHALGHQYRMNPAVQEMRARVQRGEVGRVFLAGGHYKQQSGLYATDYNWRMTEGGMSCGLSDIGTHWVDTARCVLGQNISRVFAAVQTVHATRTLPDGRQVDVDTDDLSCVMLQFDDGTQGMLTVSKVSAGHMNDLVLDIEGQNCALHWAQETPNHLRIGYKGAPNAVLQIAPALVDPSVASLVTLPGGHPLGFADALCAAMRDFYGAVRGEIAQSAMRCATFADGFEGIAFVEAALRSHRSGGWEPVLRP